MTDKTTTYKFRVDQPVRITGGKHAGKSGRIVYGEPAAGIWIDTHWVVDLTRPGELDRWSEISEKDIISANDILTPEPTPPSPEVPGPFPIGTRFRDNRGGAGKVVGYGLVSGSRSVMYDGEIHATTAFIDWLEVEGEAAKVETSPFAYQWTRGDKVIISGGFMLPEQPGELVGLLDDGTGRWRVRGLGGWVCTVHPRDMRLVDGVKAEPPVAHRFAVGDQVNIVSGPYSPSRGEICKVYEDCVICIRRDAPDCLLGVFVYSDQVELVKSPEPVTHQWAAGDKARIKDVPASHRTWDHTFGPGMVRLVLGIGDEVTLLEKASKIPDEWRFKSDRCEHLFVLTEDIIEPIPAEPVAQPEPPATILYRVEYPVTEKTSIVSDGEGCWVDAALVSSRRAALVPLAAVADRICLADILEVLHDYEPGYEDFIVRLVGGRAVEPYAVGDRVVIASGAHKGEAWYLVERDKGNDQRWWMSRKRMEDGGQGWLGLHVDSFEREELGDQ